jgi:hypothetical protein
MNDTTAPGREDDFSSPTTRTWITGLVIGIITITLAACGVFIAYKQLRRTRNPNEMDTADVEEVPGQDDVATLPASNSS